MPRKISMASTRFCIRAIWHTLTRRINRSKRSSGNENAALDRSSAAFLFSIDLYLQAPFVNVLPGGHCGGLAAAGGGAGGRGGGGAATRGGGGGGGAAGRGGGGAAAGGGRFTTCGGGGAGRGAACGGGA